MLGKTLKGKIVLKKKKLVQKHGPGIVAKELNKILADPEDDNNYKKEKKKNQKKDDEEDLEKGEKKKRKWKLFGKK